MAQSTTIAPTKPQLRWPALDGLRAVAIILVALGHSWFSAAYFGFLGVDVFFVLSGFLITDLLLKELERTNTVDYKRFLFRRMLRLMPALVFVTVGSLALLALFPNPKMPMSESIRGAGIALFYVTDFAEGWFNTGAGMLGHTWSLSIEEHFYLVWPLVLIALWKHTRRIEPMLYLALIGVLGITFIRVTVGTSMTSSRMYFSPDLHSDGLLLGSVLALALRHVDLKTRLAKAGEPLAIVGMMLIIGACFNRPNYAFPYQIGFTLSTLGAAFVISGVLTGRGGRVQRVLESRPLVELGKISYGLYLWNYVFLRILQPHTRHTPQPVVLLINFALTTMMAVISYRYVETPFLKMKDRLTR